MAIRKYNGVHFHFNYNTQKLNIYSFVIFHKQVLS